MTKELLELLVAGYLPYLHPPRTDIIDLVALALGERDVACVHVMPQANAEPSFRRLVSIAMTCGLFVADPNGRLGAPEEYVEGLPANDTWLVTRRLDRLHALVTTHAHLHSLGFGRWETHLGEALGYPPCCVRAYAEQVRAPEAHGPFWAAINVAARSCGEIVLSFAPCRWDCQAACEQTLARLRVARRLGVLEDDAVADWVRQKFGSQALIELRATEPIFDSRIMLAGFRVPRRSGPTSDLSGPTGDEWRELVP